MSGTRDHRAPGTRATAWRRWTAGVLGIAVILGLGVAALQVGQRNLAAAEADRLNARANFVRDIAATVHPDLDPAQQVAVTSLPRFTASPGPVNEVLLRQNLGDPAVSGVAFVALLDRDGHLVQALPAGTSVDVSAFGDAWSRVLDGRPAVADGMRRGDAVVTTTLWPAGAGQPWGIFAMGVVLTRTSDQELLVSLGSENGEPGGIVIADRQGTAVAAWDPALVGRSVLDPDDVAGATSAPHLTVSGRGDDETTTITAALVDGYVLAFQQRTDLLLGDLRAAQHQRDLTLLGVLAAALVALTAFQLTRELAARRDERRVDDLLRNSRDVVLVVDGAGRVAFTSAAVETLLDRPAEAWRGQPVGEVCHPDDAGRLAALVADPGSGPVLNVRLRTATGGSRWFDVEARDLSGHPEVGGILLTCHDIGERKGLQDELLFQASHDRLTGLPNRAAFTEHLERLVQDGCPVRPLAVLYVDLDGFKPVNDTLGHDAGDHVLTTVAQRLPAAVGPGALVARLGGDEFVIVLDGADAPAAAEACRSVLSVVREPISVAASIVHVDASIGAALAGPGVAIPNVEQLVRVADEAMYRAKRSGRGRFDITTPPWPLHTAVRRNGAGRRTTPAPVATVAPTPEPARFADESSGPGRHRVPVAAAGPVLVAVAVVLGIAGVGFAQTVAGRHAAERQKLEEHLEAAARAAVFYSKKYDTGRYQYIADANPWTFDGSAMDQEIVRAWATNPAAGVGTHTMLAAPDGHVLASWPFGLTAVAAADPHWADAAAGRGVYLPWIEDPDVARSYMLLPVHRDGRVVAVVVHGVSVREGTGATALRRSTEASFPAGGWSLLDAEGVIYISWNPRLIGQKVADPAELGGLRPGEARTLPRDGRVVVASPITSTAVPTYLALDVPAADFYHDLRVGQTARDLSLLLLVIAAVAGLAAVNDRRVRAVRRSERRLDALLQQAHDIVVVVDAEGLPTFVSSAVHRLLGYGPDDPLDLDVVHPDDRARLAGLIAEVGRKGSASVTDVRICDRRGSWAWFDVDAVDLRRHPEIGGFLLTLHEVSERKALQDQLAYRATRDALTGLLNRNALSRRLDRLVEGPDRRPFAVLFVDLDHFKPVNDTYGHDVGDEVLRVIARRFEGSVRTGDGDTGDLVSRLGGDEFAIVLADTTTADAEATAHRLLQVAREPVAVGDITIQVGATIGVSLSDPDQRHPDTVLREADQAMYRAKETGRDTFAVAR